MISSVHKNVRPLSVTRSSRCCSMAIHGVTASSSSQAPEANINRRFLLSLAMMSPLVAIPAPAQAKYDSALCSYKDTEEESDVCRRQALADASKLGYSAERKGFGEVGGVPVSVLDQTYVKSSISLMDDIETYLGPIEGKSRVALAKKVKTEGLDWVSKYARGGSARTQSARKLYIAVDGLVGFLAANGIAPVPKAKIQATMMAVEDARKLLAELK